MQQILEAIEAGAPPEEIGALPIPESYRAAFVRRDDVGMFEGMASADKDPTKSIHIGEVATPELAPDEAYVAVMASSINFNTVWTSIFEPVPTFAFLDRFARESVWAERHALPYQVVGSDASGVVLQVGSAVRNWKPGDRVHGALQLRRRPGPVGPRRLDAGGQPAHLGLRDELRRPRRPRRGEGQPADAQARPPHVGGGGGQRALQLDELPHARRRSNGAGMKQGDVVLVWGATGRHRRLRRPVRAERRRHPGRRRVLAGEGRRCCTSLGVEAVIDRKAERLPLLERRAPPRTSSEWRRFGKDIRELVGEDPDIVFEHPGRQTMGASIFVTKRGGTVVTCAATSGYMVEFDNRHFWMKLKRLIASPLRQLRRGVAGQPADRQGHDPAAALRRRPAGGDRRGGAPIHRNEHEGKLGVLCLAPREGLGIDDPEFRAKVGEDRITLFRRHGG